MRDLALSIIDRELYDLSDLWLHVFSYTIVDLSCRKSGQQVLLAVISLFSMLSGPEPLMGSPLKYLFF